MTDSEARASDVDRAEGQRNEFTGDRLSRLTAPPELEDEENRKRWGLGTDKDDRGPYMIELNVQHVDGLAGAGSAFRDLFRQAIGDWDKGPPWEVAKVSKAYF